MTKNDNIFNFPAKYHIKIIAKIHKELESIIINVIKKYTTEQITQNKVNKKFSKNNNYVSYTIALNIINKEQIDNINKSLQAHPLISYVL